MKKNRTAILNNVGTVLFVFGVVSSLAVVLFSSRLWANDTGEKHYKEEIRTIERFDDAVIDPEHDRIYVFFETGSFVNTYDCNGNFLWAAAIPYHSHGGTEFCIHKERLLLSHDDTYVYHAVTGEFIEKIAGKGLEDIPEIWGEFDDSSNEIFDYGEKAEQLRNKSVWSGICGDVVGLPFTLLGAFLVGIAIFCDRMREYRNAPKDFEDRSAGALRKVCRIASIVFGTYAVGNILLALFGSTIQLIGIFPLGIGFIVLNAILYHKREKVSEQGEKIVGFWFAVEWICFIAAFFSVVAVAVLFGS